MTPEFIAPPATPLEYKQAVFEFRDIFVDALASIERENGDLSSDTGMPLSSLFASPLSKVIFRGTCSPTLRAIFDAQLTLPLAYGRNTKWEDFKKFFNAQVIFWHESCCMALPLDGFDVCKGKNVTTLDLNSLFGESALAEFQIGSYKTIRGVRDTLRIPSLFLSRQ